MVAMSGSAEEAWLVSKFARKFGSNSDLFRNQTQRMPPKIGKQTRSDQIKKKPANKRNNPVPKEFTCDFIKSDGEVCGAKFPTSAGMKNHSKLHYTGKRTFNVISCDKCYNYYPKKSEHVCLSASTSN